MLEVVEDVVRLPCLEMELSLDAIYEGVRLRHSTGDILGRMALIAEELVQEWLNRQGYFTIRGAKVGYNEIDLLALRAVAGTLKCRHIEVSVNVRPIGYMGPEKSAKTQTPEKQRENALAWAHSKFDQEKVVALRNKLAPGQHWQLETVTHIMKGEHQLTALIGRGIRVLRLSDIIAELRAGKMLLTAVAG